MIDDHLGILEHDDIDVGDGAQLDFGAEGLRTIRHGVMIRDVFAGDIAPVAEAVAWMNIRCCENRLQSCPAQSESKYRLG
ncbi:hypothetical protein [Beijerinckia sp. L45]|uniref:hypothetical protein n=1 Tax=Beijerinckia sp. L45 TaxID=1641855 RepID=UPI001FEFDCCC|nr:hypothetical protein [Beijerinckia sp. L45]